jgi:predicted nucleic acid-binding protein
MMTVVDASVILGLLTNRAEDRGLRQALSATQTLHAPELIDAVVASGIRGLLIGAKIEPARAAEMVADYLVVRITRHSMTPYLPRVLELRHNLSAYDAFYVALAEALPAEFITLDAKLAGSPAGNRGHAATIRVL